MFKFIHRVSSADDWPTIPIYVGQHRSIENMAQYFNHQVSQYTNRIKLENFEKFVPISDNDPEIIDYNPFLILNNWIIELNSKTLYSECYNSGLMYHQLIIKIWDWCCQNYHALQMTAKQ